MKPFWSHDFEPAILGQSQQAIDGQFLQVDPYLECIPRLLEFFISSFSPENFRIFQKFAENNRNMKNFENYSIQPKYKIFLNSRDLTYVYFEIKKMILN